MRALLAAMGLGLALGLTACGGGGGSDELSSSIVVPDTTSPTPTSLSCGVSQEQKGGQCVSICTPAAEKVWVRAHLDDAYLWYKEIIDVPAVNYATPEEYFYDLLVDSKDHFSFTADQAETDTFFEEGTDIGYGITWLGDPRLGLSVGFVEPGSPGQQQGITRGDILLAINEQAVSDDTYWWLYPSRAGEQTTVEVFRPSLGITRTVTLTAAKVVHRPVPQTSVLTMPDNKKVGYLLFNDHIATATAQLATAIRQFKAAQVSDLVLDVRYNGGGYLYVASELSTMIAGNTLNKIFTRFEFNDKHTADNENYFFEQTDDKSQALPSLNLKRVFVLTGPGTCSASEAIINGLSPYIEVIRIGEQTCGKPYGFLQENNCGTAYFAIRFQGVNSVNQSVPTVGFAPHCQAMDTLDYALGDSRENLLKTALAYRELGVCSTAALAQSRKAMSSKSAMEIQRAPRRSNMILK